MAIVDQNLTPEAATGEPVRTRAQWLEDRRSGVGASEAAAALGESPFKSPWELYLEKTGAIEPPDLSDKLYVRLGQVMERGVGEIYADMSGRRVEFWPQTEMIRHPDRSWMLCTPDATQFDDSRGPGILSIKTTDERFLKEWERDGIPLHYQIQAQDELSIRNLPWGTVAVAFGRRTLKWYDFDRNQRFIEVLETRIDQFWRMVETQTPPPIDWTERCSKALQALHPQDNGQTIILPPEAADWDRYLRRVKRHIAILKRFKTEYENRIKAAIGDNSYGELPDGECYSWKSHDVREHVVAEHTKRPLVRVEPKTGKKAPKAIAAPEADLLPFAPGEPALSASPKRKKLTVADIRMRLLAQKPNCRWCNKTLTKRTATLEHVVPKAHGGTNRWENLALACSKCNSARGDTGLDPKDLEDFEE